VGGKKHKTISSPPFAEFTRQGGIMASRGGTGNADLLQKAQYGEEKCGGGSETQERSSQRFADKGV